MLVTLQGFSQKCSYKEGTKIFPISPSIVVLHYIGNTLRARYYRAPTKTVLNQIENRYIFRLDTYARLTPTTKQ